MTQQEIKQAAVGYNHQRYLANDANVYTPKMSAEVYNAFIAGANCAVERDTRKPITDAMVWKAYHFIEDYKAGNFGFIPMQDALDMYFEKYNPDGNFVVVGKDGQIYERKKTRRDAERVIAEFEANDLAAGLFEEGYYEIKHV